MDVNRLSKHDRCSGVFKHTKRQNKKITEVNKYIFKDKCVCRQVAVLDAAADVMSVGCNVWWWWVSVESSRDVTQMTSLSN